jgi:hypothetical protein
VRPVPLLLCENRIHARCFSPRTRKVRLFALLRLSSLLARQPPGKFCRRIRLLPVRAISFLSCCPRGDSDAECCMQSWHFYLRRIKVSIPFARCKVRLTATASCARYIRATLRACGFQPRAFAQLGKGRASPVPVASPPVRCAALRKPCPFPRHPAFTGPLPSGHGACAHDGRRQPAAAAGAIPAQRQPEARAAAQYPRPLRRR